MFKVENYLSKQHSMIRYNCWDFIREVWLELMNEDIGFRTPKGASREDMKYKFAREEVEFERINKPQDPCIVLFTRKTALPHVGVYVKGKVLHLPEHNTGKHEPLSIAALGFKETRFYLCKQ